MKAGIFKRQDNGKHIYVRKDRSIGAIEITDVHPCESEYKVSERVGGKYVNVPDSNGGYFVTVAERVADAPKGVNDCVKALGEYVDSLKRAAEEANDDDFSLNVDGNDSARETMREGTLVPPADAPEGDPVDLDPELAAYHGEADDSDREAVNLLPDDVSPAQSLHEFVAERLHRIDAGGAAPPVFVEKPTDISADGLREILAHKEEVQQEIARKMAMPRAIEAPYGMSKAGSALWNAMSDIADGRLSGPLVIVANPDGVEEAQRLVAHYRERYPRMAEVAVEMFDRSKPPSGGASYLHYYQVPQTVFLSTPSDAKRFVEEHLQAKFEAGGEGKVGLRENEVAAVLSPPSRSYFTGGKIYMDGKHVGNVAPFSVDHPKIDEDGLDIGGALSATGTVTVTFSDHKALNQIREFARRMSEQAPPPTCIAVEKGSEVYHGLVRRIAAATGHTVAEVEAWIGLRCGEFRLCHAAAARKHKKKRDRHVWWHPVFGCYAWKKVEVAA